ncbi:MAG: hypothetical protein WCD53_19720 [Microcoleus sp.]
MAKTISFGLASSMAVARVASKESLGAVKPGISSHTFSPVH